MKLRIVSPGEYLAPACCQANSHLNVEMRYQDENIWLTQKMMATLYDVGINTINYHLKTIFDDSELDSV